MAALRRAAWAAVSSAPLAYLAWTQGARLVKVQAADGPELRLVLGPWAASRVVSGSDVLVRGPSLGSGEGWRRVIGVRGDIVVSRRGMYEFITGPYLWVRARRRHDANALPDDVVDSEDVGPLPTALVSGVAYSIVWPPSKAKVLKPVRHRDNLGHEVDMGTVRVRNFDAPPRDSPPVPTHDTP